jgi:hypothetical protein
MSEIVSLEKQNLDGVPALIETRPEDWRRTGDIMVGLFASFMYRFIARRGATQATVHGGNLQPLGGLDFQIIKPLEVWRADEGKHFEHFDLSPQLFTVPVPDAANPRIDRVYARLEENMPGATQTRRAKVNPREATSSEGDINAVITKRNQIALVYQPGVAGPAPVAPEIPAGCVPLWQVNVPANAVSLSQDKNSFVDERHNFIPLEEVVDKLGQIVTIINVIQQNRHRHPADNIDIDESQLDPSKQGKWPTAQDAFNDLSRQKSGGGGGGNPPPGASGPRVRPEILSKRLPSHPLSGTLEAIGIVADENGAPAVEIPADFFVDFAGILRPVAPTSFVEGALNARFFNKHVNAAADSKNLPTPVTLGNVVLEETNGGGTYALQNELLPPYGVENVAHLACARDDRYVDLFGVTDANSGGLAYWIEFDSQTNQTVTRPMSGDVPLYGVKYAFPLGNGQVLLAAAAVSVFPNDSARIKWYRLNTADGVSTAIPDGPGDVNTFASEGFTILGDLIIGGDNAIVMLVIGAEGIAAPQHVGHFEYHVATNQFIQVQPIGQVPAWLNDSSGIVFHHMAACVLREGELALVDGATGPGKTFVYQQSTRAWRQLNIAQPVVSANPFNNGYFWGVTVANVNGRVHMASATTTIWELRGSTEGYSWQQVRVPALEGDNAGGSRFGALMTGLMFNGLPTGNGYLFGGRPAIGSGIGLQVPTRRQVWKFEATGIVASQCGGQNGITLGAGATSATVALPPTATGYLPWAVGKYSLMVQGIYLPGQVRAVVTFDNWVHDYPLLPGQTVSVTSSDNNPIRRVRLILSGTPSSKPCVSQLVETFETQGGPGLAQQVIRFNPADGEWYAKMDRDMGKIVVEATAEQSRSDMCYMLKIVKAPGAFAPHVLNIKNKQRIDDIVVITKEEETIENYLPVEAAKVKARKIDGDGYYHTMANPEVLFNGTITPAGLAAGESCELELDA